jgi:hypothetical protein
VNKLLFVTITVAVTMALELCAVGASTNIDTVDTNVERVVVTMHEFSKQMPHEKSDDVHAIDSNQVQDQAPNSPQNTPEPRKTDAPTRPFKCSQPAPEQDSAMREAEANEYRVGRVEFVGNKTTQDGVLRRRVTLKEGDVFTRDDLVTSLKNVSSLKGVVYPVRVRDVILQLDQADKVVDMTICLREVRRSHP